MSSGYVLHRFAAAASAPPHPMACRGEVPAGVRQRGQTGQGPGVALAAAPSATYAAPSRPRVVRRVRQSAAPAPRRPPRAPPTTARPSDAPAAASPARRSAPPGRAARPAPRWRPRPWPAPPATAEPAGRRPAPRQQHQHPAEHGTSRDGGDQHRAGCESGVSDHALLPLRAFLLVLHGAHSASVRRPHPGRRRVPPRGSHRWPRVRPCDHEPYRSAQLRGHRNDRQPRRPAARRPARRGRSHRPRRHGLLRQRHGELLPGRRPRRGRAAAHGRTGPARDAHRHRAARPGRPAGRPHRAVRRGQRLRRLHRALPDEDGPDPGDQPGRPRRRRRARRRSTPPSPGRSTNTACTTRRTPPAGRCAPSAATSAPPPAACAA